MVPLRNDVTWGISLDEISVSLDCYNPVNKNYVFTKGSKPENGKVASQKMYSFTCEIPGGFFFPENIGFASL